jgi:hypothetical protein
MAGKARTRRNREFGIVCGAKTRKGTPCQRHLLLKGGKCPNHGGMSTGPKTPEGRAKSTAARKAGLARYWEKRRLAALAGLATSDPRFGRSSAEK